MSEETEKVEKPEEKPAEKETKVSAKDIAAEKAYEQGWRPEDEFYSDPDNEGKVWVDADEFLRRGELFGKIDELKNRYQSREFQHTKELQDVKKGFEEFKEHFIKSKEAEFKRALADLKAEKRAALEENDTARVLAVDDRIDALRDEHAEEQAKAAREAVAPKVEAPTLRPEFVAWVEKNAWYNQNLEMREFADSIGHSFARSRPGIDPTEVLKYVEGKVKKAYPEQFTNPNRDKATAVEGGGRTSRPTSSRKTDYELTDEQRQAMHRFIKIGAIKNEAEYIESLKALDKA